MSSTANIPSGFQPSGRSSALLETLGPIYESGAPGDYRIGLRVDHRHINNKGFCHGAVLAMLADVHLGRLCGLAVEPRPVLVTAGLTLAYLAAAKQGDWLEATGQVDRIGRSLACATGLVLAEGKPVLRATGTFQVMGGKAE